MVNQHPTAAENNERLMQIALHDQETLDLFWRFYPVEFFIH
jgi:hypothetical protein